MSSSSFEDVRARQRRSFEKWVLEELAPCSAAVDEDGRLLCLAGRSSPYLQPKADASSSNVLEQLDPALRPELQSALSAASREGRAVSRTAGAVRLIVRPIPSEPGLFALVLQPAEAGSAAPEREDAVVCLREANAQLLAADRRKDEFLAALSHELRNPLAPIKNGLFILERAGPLGEQAKRALAVIDRQVNHLSRLVDDLVDVARIAQGQMLLRLERLEFCEIVRRAVEDHRSLFARAGVALTLQCAPGEVWLDGDWTRLTQVVGNLLHNAAKFTPAGGSVEVTVAPADGARAALRVRDTGAGIDPKILPLLFRPFTQAEATLNRRHGGLGLGLALVKSLVEMHGGAVRVSSDGLGQGAEFIVELPIDRASSTRRHTTDPNPGHTPARRILVIEDSVDAADTLAEVLQLAGHLVEIARDGAAGLQKARQFRPDVVLCDIGLPTMDGYAVARAIRAEPELAGTRLIALTGYASPEDVAKAKAAGFDRHLAKPPRIGQLQRAIEE